MPRTGAIARLIRDWVGIPDIPAARRWALASVVDALGTGMLMPIGVLYFTVVVGLPLESVGVGLGIAGLVGALSTPVTGILIDRVGAKLMVIASLLVGAVAYLGYLGVQSWWLFVVVVSLAHVAENIARPAKKAFVASIVEAEDRVRLMAFQRSIRNAGYGGGALVTAGLLALDNRAGYQIVLVVDAVTFLIAAAIVAGIAVAASTPSASASTSPTGAPGPSADLPGSAAGTSRLPDGYRAVLRDRRYLAVTLANVLVRLHATALFVGLPLWVQQHTSAPPSLVGILFTVNTVLVVLLQVRFVGGVATAAQTRPVYLRASVAFVAAAAAYTTAGWFDAPLVLPILLLVVAVLAHTAAELNSAVGEWTVSVDLAPPQLRGRYLSVFTLSASLHDVIGPMLVTFLIARAPGVSWAVIAALMTAGCLISAATVTRRAPAPHRPDLPERSLV